MKMTNVEMGIRVHFLEQRIEVLPSLIMAQKFQLTNTSIRCSTKQEKKIDSMYFEGVGYIYGCK
jgi:hypothetical protein